MFYIHTFELAQQQVLPKVEGIHRVEGFLALIGDRATGEMLSPVFNPLLAYQWEGFEIWPSETGVDVALRSNEQYFEFNGNDWEPVANASYYPPNLIRRYIEKWRGPLQLQLRLTRQADRRSPRVAGCKVGYYVADSILNYLLQFALPEFFKSQRVQLERKTNPAPDGLSLAIPNGINANRMRNPIVLGLSTQQRQSGTVVTTPSARVQLSQAIAQQPTALIFDYQCPITPLAQEEMFQISEFPCGTIRALEATNLYQFANTPQDWIRLPDDQVRTWQANYCYDAPFEVSLFAQTTEEAEAIAEQLITAIRRNGFINVPPWGETVFAWVQQPIRSGPGIAGKQVTHSSTKSANFRFLIKNLPRGIWHEKDQLITRIAPLS